MICLPTDQAAAAVLAKSDWQAQDYDDAQAVTERVRFTMKVIVGSRSTRPYPVPPTSKSRSSGGYRNVGGGDGDGDGGDAVAPLPAPRGGGEWRRRGGRRRGGRWVAEAEWEAVEVELEQQPRSFGLVSSNNPV